MDSGFCISFVFLKVLIWFIGSPLSANVVALAATYNCECLMAIIRGGWGFPWERTPDQWLNTNTQVHSEIQTGMQMQIKLLKPHT